MKNVGHPPNTEDVELDLFELVTRAEALHLPLEEIERRIEQSKAEGRESIRDIPAAGDIEISKAKRP